MALRIRKNGRIVCAAHHPPEEGDLYLDDLVHMYLAQCDPKFCSEINQLSDYDWKTHEYHIQGRSYT